ncbi:MAG: glycosyltransferase [Mycobacteriaceae bacterium]
MTGRIVYASFATPQHSGGVHVGTQHVQLLRAAGRDAWLWLPDPDDRTSWIDATVPVIGGRVTTIGADDLLVLPEVPVVPGRDPAPGARKAILNQNHFYTYAACPDVAAEKSYPGWDPAPAVWTVSAESRDLLGALHPELPVSLVPNLIDGELFAPRDSSRARVSWFPRKRPREASLLRTLLRRDERLHGVELQELVNAPRVDVARALGATTVFVALGHSESFGLPVAEALASSCLVVGYDGGGGHELFEAPGAWRVPEQRPLLLRDAVVDLVHRAPELGALRRANRAWVLDRYRTEKTAAALLAATEATLTRPGAAATATHPAAWLDVLGPSFTAWA